MAACKSKGFLQELTDELHCAICDDQFKRPKYLSCLHTFCEECIISLVKSQNGRMLPCPLCRELTPIPREGIRRGLRNNSMALNLLEKISSQSSFSADKRKEKPDDTCSSHQDEILRYYCRSCQILVCRECCILDHCRPKHDVCKVQEVTGNKKRVLEQIVKDAEEKLSKCKATAQCNKEVQTQLHRKVLAARDDFSARAEAILTRVSARCEAVSNALTEVEQTREIQFRKNADQNQDKERKVEKALKDATRLLNGPDVKLVKEADTLVSHLKKVLIEGEPQEIDPKLGFLEYKKTPDGSAAAASLGEVYEDWTWVPYARTLDKVNLDRARGVAVFPSGTIAVVLNANYEDPIVIIEWEELERCLLVDGSQKYLPRNKKNISVKTIKVDSGDPRDVIPFPVYHIHLTCGGCGMNPLSGPRYTCLVCADYHLCIGCINKGIHKEHSFQIFTHKSNHSPKLGVVSDQCDVHLYDVKDGACVYTLEYPSDFNQRRSGRTPSMWSIATDQCGEVFIGDGNSNQVFHFKLKKTQPNATSGRLNLVISLRVDLKPWFIAANSNTRQILVSNWKSCRVDAISYQGQPLFSITHDVPHGGPLRPNGVCFHGDDTIYVVHRDLKHFYGEVHRYNARDGTHVGVAVTGLIYPHGISIGDNGKMVIADWSEVKVFQRKPVIVEPKMLREDEVDSDDDDDYLINYHNLTSLLTAASLVENF